MPLTAGTRIGPYEVLGPLGEGGMGEVYRARDSRLQRDVAIKILPEAFAADPDRLARFKREAQVLAALNHPHIAAIYGVEEGPTQATGAARWALSLVLELVEGPTLADRIAQGPIPVDEALPMARQIAAALEAAHERGIVHRDLKPANVKLRPDGTVKVLDFGLAKAVEAGGAVVSATELLSLSPTVTSPAMMTGAGVILGTASYMSPEQARGRPVDKRSDIWAFGCVLYEMLTGRRAFAGNDLAEVLARVLEREPDFTLLPASTPPMVRASLVRCLEKDRQRRLPDIGVVRLDIDDALAMAHGGSAVRALPSAPTRTRARIAWPIAASAAAIGLALGGLTGWWWSQRASPPTSNQAAPLTRTLLELPATAPLALGTRVPQIGFDSPALAVSPDGRRLAYIAESPTGTLVHLRDLASTSGSPVAGTDGAIYAFFSPDGRSLGFLTDDRVKKVALDGTAPITLTTAVTPVNATWTPSGQIYFAESEGRSLSRVGASGGTATVVRAKGPNVRFSQVLPGERAALGTVMNRSISADYADVALVSLADGSLVTLVESGYDARFVPPGHLLFARGGGLYAVAFDPAAGRVTGDAIPVAGDVSMESLFAQANVAASANGLLAYVPGGQRARGRLSWVDREGRVEDVGAPTRVYGVVNLSPDGARLAVHVADVTDYIWLYDLARHEARNLAATGAAGWPVWRPDGGAIAFLSWSASYLEGAIVSQPADGGSPATLQPSGSARLAYPASWSPDGTVIATNVLGATTAGGFLDVSDRSMRLDDTFGLMRSFSPDGRWLAYWDTAGRSEVVIRSYPAGDVSRQFSEEGGVEPHWSASGELFYRNGNRWMASAVRTSPGLGWDPPRQAFQTDYLDTPGRSYDVSPDGRRLLVVKRAEPDVRDRIHVITNWTALLKRAP
jgi:eukaryotic-like serine/threonine-protein kinase